MLLIFQAIVLSVVINQPAALRLFKKTFAASAAVNLLCSIWTPATELGDIPTSGLFLKDHIKVQALDDPKIRGVKLYIADTDIPLLEKLNKDFFDNPSATSLACTKVGKVQAVKDIPTNKDGEEVFEEDRNLFLKTIRVRRLYDKEANTVIYVSHSTRWNKDADSNKGRFKTAMCAVNLND